MNTKNHSQSVIEYHERTKHLPNRPASSSGYLDWANEPNPFRSYEGANTLKLPFANTNQGANYSDLFERKNNKFQAFSLKNIALLLELSMGLSTWKSYSGTLWALRINPSSGNLHPTETHLVLPPLQENNNSGGIFHYNPLLHVLESRAEFDEQFWQKIREYFNQDGFFIGLTSIYWRESWKYGERAFRYCNHDIGHAMACLSFSANLLGWKMTYLSSLSNKDMEIILGFQKTRWKEFEKEEPDLLLFVHKSTESLLHKKIPPDIITSFESIQFKGEPNQLSKEHVDWYVIDEVSSATDKPATDEETYLYKDHEYFENEIPSMKAESVIRQRRSAQAYDGKTAITKKDFFAILDKTIPRSHSAPFDLEPGEIFVHLIIFVHRVVDLDSGLYFLIRNEKDLTDIKHNCHPYFFWERVHDAPQMLPLYLLKKGDFRRDATFASCQQDIAGDGAFSVGMIAKFRENIEENPFLYRQLFWETGMIGQILYLEAEAHAVRGTGIGCFFDDVVHKLLGFDDNTYQSLYHFTIGGTLEDKRITTLPPYYHLNKQ
ncbi:MAG: SagB/ThcOx family dehydrogenase [Candidatus Scalindua sp.]